METGKGNKMKMGACAPLALVLGLIFATACATSGGSSRPASLGKKRYIAHSIIYQRAAQPSVTEKVFRCEMELLVRPDLKSYRFSNYISGGEKPDAVVTLAISGRAGGLGIYSASGEPMAEYPAGKASENMVEFEVRQKDGVTKVKWYLGADSILSIFESYDSAGGLGFSESTVYLSK
jgi:hypothetical protein